MTNIELLKKYATICKRQRDEAGCEECELNNSCLICAVDDSITIDNISMEKLLKDIENTEIPCKMIITISYSAEVIPLIFSIISLWDISDFLQNNMEDMIKPVINNVINALSNLNINAFIMDNITSNINIIRYLMFSNI